MKGKYPAEAFALGIILFSAGMREAFVSGVLVLLSVVFAELLKGLLENLVPKWSLRACVLIGTGAVSASVFLLGFTWLGIAMETSLWAMTAILGLLSAWHVLNEGVRGDYGDLFFDSGIVWGFWILTAAAREFLGLGSVFGNTLLKADFQSKAFLGDSFAFAAAGLVLAFAAGALKKSCESRWDYLVIIPAVIFLRPFTMESFGEVIGVIWASLVPVILFFSVKKTLKFSRPGKAYRGLPSELLAMGIIYMILSVY